MNRQRLGELARGIGGFAGLLVLVVGVPAVLAVGVGWPLPHAVPSLADLHRLVAGRYHPGGSFYLKVVAIVAWIAWTEVAACAVAEIRATLAGRRAWRVRFAGPLQPFVAGLVAAVVLALPPGGGEAPAHTPPLAVALSGPLRPRRITLVAEGLDAASTGHANERHATANRERSQEHGGVVRLTVKPRDTLWGLAERYLGNPLDWREIFDLNVGKPQPGGGSLTDPSLIRPGWVLELPARAAQRLPDLQGADRRQEEPPKRSEHVAPRRLPHREPAAPPSPNGSTAKPAHHHGVRHEPDRSHAPPRGSQHTPAPSGALVELPSGAVVSTSFLAGVAAAVALGRLRRRRAYRPRPPVAGWSGRGWEPPATLASVLRAGQADVTEDSADEDGEQPPESLDERRIEVDVPLGAALAGQLGGEPLVMDMADGGLGVDGPGAEDVGRALIADVVTRHLPGHLECIVEASLWRDLLPDVDTFPGLRTVRTVDDFLREAEAELIRRVRLLEDEELEDLGAYWKAHPEDPMPVLLVACRAPTASIEGRLRGVLDLGRRVGIGALVIGGGSGARTAVTADVDGRVQDASAPEHKGAQLVCLRREEAAAALVAVGAARRVDDELVPEEPTAAESESKLDTSSLPASSSEAPVRVHLLGSYRIEVAGEEVRSGMRLKARELLAWLCCHPDGGTPEAVVEALWPEGDPSKVSQRFWNAVTSLRGRLREVSGIADLRLLDRYGTRYRLDDGELSVDLWQLERALAEASKLSSDGSRGDALARAVAGYTDDLLKDCDWLWVEGLRGDLRARILDALTRLAELRGQDGEAERALTALARAVEIDPYAEELYRRMMQLHIGCGRLLEARMDLDKLTARLDELGADPQPETLRIVAEIPSRPLSGSIFRGA
ncbi:MAG: BTAD domain-containing putative transcriptional regulator [Acidimicrobiales bacterium]